MQKYWAEDLQIAAKSWKNVYEKLQVTRLAL